MKHLRTDILSLSLLLITLITCGCASIAKPQSFDQQLAYALGTATSVRQSATDLLSRGRISREKALEVNAGCDKAREAIRLARSVGDTQVGREKLQQALNILLVLEAQLKEAQ